MKNILHKKCNKCGKTFFKKPNHSINYWKTKNFAQYPELRFAINNGITFSDKAHKEFHRKYGRINNTLEQLQEFLNYKI